VRIERKVMRITKEQQQNMIEETGVQSSIDEEDLRGYLEQVMREVKGKSDTWFTRFIISGICRATKDPKVSDPKETK
jgi:hypothetical protein